MRMLTLLVLLACKGGGNGDTNENDTEPVDTGEPLPADACERWQEVRNDWAPAEFTGNVDECDAGTPAVESLETFKRGLNLYRWMAGLDPVTLDLELSQKAQQCALMMAANSDLDNDPPSTWECYTDDGAEAADNSHLVNLGGVYAIDSSIGGETGDTKFGGRRWLLSNQLGTIGVGFTDRYTCIWLEQDGDSGKEWVAWPPPGPVSKEAMSWVDTAGWTWQSDTIDILLTPTVRITMDGTDMPVRTTILEENYGSKAAIKFVPSGWKAELDKTYHVSISGLGETIEYDVEVTCR
jgi:hypothetical protein